MGIYACGGYGSRGPEEGCHGNEAMGIYMHAGAMEIGVRRRAVMGRRRWGYTQEEVRRRKEGGGEGGGG